MNLVLTANFPKLLNITIEIMSYDIFESISAMKMKVGQMGSNSNVVEIVMTYIWSTSYEKIQHFCLPTIFQGSRIIVKMFLASSKGYSIQLLFKTIYLCILL